MFNKLKTNSKFKKVGRFYRIYGFSRTYIKIIGRTRKQILPFRLPFTVFRKNPKNVAIIGCGQFAFANIAYFLKYNLGDVVYGAYDIDKNEANSFISYYKGKAFSDPEELINDSNVKYVYIASNHATHTNYAISALKQNKIVYVEKPISVNFDQFNSLMNVVKGKRLYVGYNRPLSPAIKYIKELISTQERNPLSLSCFITGHKIPEDHWYRNFEEGTRVCGNIGHWLDLSVNLLNKIGLPSQLSVAICASSKTEKDDNLNITITSDSEDIISIMLSSREEPFEGINETINIQHSNVIAKIDDFRRLTVWNGEGVTKKRYFRKDVGHKNAIMQPFSKENERDFNEIVISTRLMLEITEAVRSNTKEFIFNI